MTNRYPRLPDELEEEYIYRVCAAKETIGTWAEVAAILNEALHHEYTESKYRKQFQAFSRMFDANQRHFLESDAYLREIEEKTLALVKERHKFSATKAEYNRMLRQQSRFELFYENIREAVLSLPVPEVCPKASSRSDRMSCLTIADIHYGARFESTHNRYSMDIALERFGTLLAQSIQHVQASGFDRMKVVMLGDSIQGILRLNDLSLNEGTTVEATVGVSRLLASFLNQLSAHCAIDYYHVPRSNHTQIRPLGSKKNELPAEDVEYIIGNYIKDLLRDNDRVTVNLENQGNHICIPLFHYNVLAMHGHCVKNAESALKDLSHFHRKPIDYMLLGHFHNGREIPVGETALGDAEVLFSSSFVGSDPYADSLMRGGKSACKLYVFDEQHGHIETHKIYL